MNILFKQSKLGQTILYQSERRVVLHNRAEKLKQGICSLCSLTVRLCVAENCEN